MYRNRMALSGTRWNLIKSSRTQCDPMIQWNLIEFYKYKEILWNPFELD